MPCNCGKGRQPHGVPAKPAAPSGSKSSTKKPATEGKPLKGVTQAFTLTTGSRVQTFGSRLEAEAARVRQGGQGVVST